jgi:hypothetical protein
VSNLIHCRLSNRTLARLVADAPPERVSLDDTHRETLSSRFRAVGGVEHRQLDAWMVERSGTPADSFRWSPAVARRVIGNASLRRRGESGISFADAVALEIDDRLLRATARYVRRGSLVSYLASCRPAELALVRAEATNWATQLSEATSGLPQPSAVATSDTYYDVERARTTLRGRRDVVIANGLTRVVIRARAGAPGKTAGAGLRADLVVDTLADPLGLAPARIIGLWPEAGVALSVDGSMENLRRGARDLVRTAVAWRRQQLKSAA